MKNKVFGPYRIAATLNQTNEHTLSLARLRTGSGWDAVLKVFVSDLCSTPEEQETLIQEMQSLTELRHPHILPLQEVGIEQNCLYTVTTYAQSGSLQDRLDRQTDLLPIQEAYTILSQIGQALQYAHEQNILHNNIKAGNILFAASGIACLADFCPATLARKRSAFIEQDDFITPQQDLYTLACLAHKLFTGHFPPNSPALTIQAPSSMKADLPLPLEEVLMKALASDPSQRYPTVTSFIHALDDACKTTGLIHEQEPETAFSPVAGSLLTGHEVLLQAAADRQAQVIQNKRIRWRQRALIALSCLLIITAIITTQMLIPSTPTPSEPHVQVSPSLPTATPTQKPDTPTMVIPTPTPQSTPTIEIIPTSQPTSPPVITPTPTPTTPVPSHLEGTLEEGPFYANLSIEGEQDWTHWGLNGITPNRKQGANLISECTIIGTDEPQKTSDNPMMYGWSDGNPTRYVDNTRTGIAVEGVNNGFALTLPADTTMRVVRIYVGVDDAQGLFTASLSDGSGATYSDSSLRNWRNTSIGVYTLTYQANQPGQYLTISYLLLNQYDDDGQVIWQAVTLR